jgi:uncharacterized protein (DUF1778 family)
MNDDQKAAGFLLRLTESERNRIESAARLNGGSVERWLLLAVLDAVERHENEVEASKLEAP